MSELRNRFHGHNDGTFTIETFQDVEPFLEKNKRELQARVEAGRRHKVEDMRKIASIPNIVAEKWLKEFGINVFDKNDMPKIKKMLNHPDYAYLKTVPGRV